MNFDRTFLQKMSWGILLIVIAAALIFVGFSGVSFFFIVPLVLLVMGIWILVTGASFYARAWGVALALFGGLWLLRWTFSVSMYVLASVFLAVIGLLVIVGSAIRQ
jgi:hypothetical protein